MWASAPCFERSCVVSTRRHDLPIRFVTSGLVGNLLRLGVCQHTGRSRTPPACRHPPHSGGEGLRRLASGDASPFPPSSKQCQTGAEFGRGTLFLVWEP